MNFFGFGKESKKQEKAKDPICGMSVVIESAKYWTVFSGKRYVFCSPGCKEEFDKNPAQYA